MSTFELDLSDEEHHVSVISRGLSNIKTSNGSSNNSMHTNGFGNGRTSPTPSVPLSSNSSEFGKDDQPEPGHNSGASVVPTIHDKNGMAARDGLRKPISFKSDSDRHRTLDSLNSEIDAIKQKIDLSVQNIDFDEIRKMRDDAIEQLRLQELSGQPGLQPQQPIDELRSQEIPEQPKPQRTNVKANTSQNMIGMLTYLANEEKAAANSIPKPTPTPNGDDDDDDDESISMPEGSSGIAKFWFGGMAYQCLMESRDFEAMYRIENKNGLSKADFADLMFVRVYTRLIPDHYNDAKADVVMKFITLCLEGGHAMNFW